jgi:hypothetical protein
MDGRAKVVEQLLAVGADAKALNCDDSSPLHLCCHKAWMSRQADAMCNVEPAATCSIAAMLIQAGAAVEPANVHGWRPLRMTIEGGHADLVQMLVQAGADVNATRSAGVTGDGLSMLALCVAHNTVQGVQLLQAAGAKSSAVYHCGHDALEVAVHTCSPAMVQAVLAYERDPPSAAALAASATYHLDLSSQGWSPSQYAIHAQLQLHLYQRVQQEDSSAAAASAVAAVAGPLDDDEGGYDGSAASLALLQGWSASTAATDAAHDEFTAQEQEAAVTTAGVQQLLVQTKAAQRAAVCSII